jgi:trehalose-phosphatase
MQPTQDTNILNDFLDRLSHAPTSVLMLDYDGTLAPFQIERDRAYPYPGVLPLLARIQRNVRTRIVVITGRPLHEVQALLSPLDGIEIWGAHGLDHLLADGTLQQVSIDQDLTAALRQAEEWLRSNDLANLMEIKPGGIAVHWRGLPKDRVEDINAKVIAGWAPLTKLAGLKSLIFEGGLELRVIRPDKGDAVASVINNLDLESPSAFLGDDLTDEDAFRKLKGRGMAILVRDEYRPTEAEVWLKPPHELLEFLEQWATRTSS